MSHKGQGISEYCGALVIASVLVAAVMTTGVDGMQFLFVTLLDSVHDLYLQVLS